MIVNTTEAIKDIVIAIRAGLVVMMAGDPGIGKSGITHGIASTHNLKLIDIRLAQCDPTDINGFPHFYEKEYLNPAFTHSVGNTEPKYIKKKVATYVPMDIFPLEGDPLPVHTNADGSPVMVDDPDNPGTLIPKKYDGWLIFFDEFNSANLAVQAASYKLVLDRMVGTHHIHPRAAMVCAGNLATNQAIVNRLSTAMQSRLVHLELQAELEPWVEWASANKLDHRIISYVQSVPKKLHNFKPDHNDKTFACPRTWEFASKLISKSPGSLKDLTALLAGTISEGVAREFIAYSSIFNDLPTYSEILKDPKGARLKEDPSLLYAISHMIAAHLQTSQIKTIMPYINRLPVEFQTITLQNFIVRNKADIATIMKEEIMREWVTKRGMDLL
jgi:hypothetical protein